MVVGLEFENSESEQASLNSKRITELQNIIQTQNKDMGFLKAELKAMQKQMKTCFVRIGHLEKENRRLRHLQKPEINMGKPARSAQEQSRDDKESTLLFKL